MKQIFTFIALAIAGVSFAQDCPWKKKSDTLEVSFVVIADAENNLKKTHPTHIVLHYEQENCAGHAVPVGHNWTIAAAKRNFTYDIGWKNVQWKKGVDVFFYRTGNTVVFAGELQQRPF